MRYKVVYGIRCTKINGDVFLHNLIYKSKDEALDDLRDFQNAFPGNEYTLVNFYLV